MIVKIFFRKSVECFRSLFFSGTAEWVGGFFLPWWVIAVVPFLVAVVLVQRPGNGFVSGFFAVGLLWAILILKTDAANEQLLSTRMAQLFGLSHGLFLLVNIFLGALVGGLSGWSGACMNKLRRAKDHK